MILSNLLAYSSISTKSNNVVLNIEDIDDPHFKKDKYIGYFFTCGIWVFTLWGFAVIFL